MSFAVCQPNDPLQLFTDGPSLEVKVGFDFDYFTGKARAPTLPPEKFSALVDTGATLSAIDVALAKYLKLPLVGEGKVAGAHGTGFVPEYLAQVSIPALDSFLYGRFSGVYLHAGGQQHLAILGRSFLRDFVMNYDGRSGAETIQNGVPPTG